MSDLPAGWAVEPLGNLLQSLRDGTHTPPKRIPQGVPLLSARNIQNGNIDLSEAYSFISEDDYLAIQRTNPISEGDILLTIVGSIGRSCVNRTSDRFTVQRSVAIARPYTNVINADYLSLLFRAPQFQATLENLASGTAQRGVYLGTLKAISIPVAPLNEQGRIVTKLERLLSSVEAAHSRLGTIPRLLKRFRQSVLAASFQMDSEQNLKRLDEIFSVQTGGTPNRKSPEFYRGGTIPWVKTGEVQNRDIDQSEEFITEKGLNNSNAKVFPAGTLLIAMYGEGKTRGQVGRLRFQAATNQACAALVNRKLSNISNQYVFLFLLGQYHQMRAQAVGGNQPNLNLSIIKSWEVPFPTQAEQHKIVRRIEALFTIADALEARYLKAKGHVDMLTQSILAKAFRGELVPQDPNDEPALILLERIRQDRKGTGPKKWRRDN